MHEITVIEGPFSTPGIPPTLPCYGCRGLFHGGKAVAAWGLLRYTVRKLSGAIFPVYTLMAQHGDNFTVHLLQNAIE